MSALNDVVHTRRALGVAVRLLAFLILFAGGADASARPVAAADVRSALAKTAVSLRNVVLDGRGRGRGDYHTTVGSGQTQLQSLRLRFSCPESCRYTRAAGRAET